MTGLHVCSTRMLAFDAVVYRMCLYILLQDRASFPLILFILNQSRVSFFSFFVHPQMAEDLIETYSMFSHALVSFSIGE